MDERKVMVDSIGVDLGCVVQGHALCDLSERSERVDIMCRALDKCRNKLCGTQVFHLISKIKEVSVVFGPRRRTSEEITDPRRLHDPEISPRRRSHHPAAAAAAAPHAPPLPAPRRHRNSEARSMPRAGRRTRPSRRGGGAVAVRRVRAAGCTRSGGRTPGPWRR